MIKLLILLIGSFGLINGAYATPTRVMEADVLRGNGNLVKLGDFENNSVANVTPYYEVPGINGVPSPRPFSGVGPSATPSLTPSIVSTDPLANSYSMLLTKSAGSGQGHGVSIPFTVQTGQKATVLRTKFLYQIASGTYSDASANGTPTVGSDMRVYAVASPVAPMTAYEVIELVPTEIKAVASPLPGYFSSEFQTNAYSTNYKLLFHVASQATAAWTMKVDGISISKENKQSGAVITDQIAYTPSLLGSSSNPALGSGATASGWYWREGASLSLRALFKVGTSPSVGSGYYYVSLPSGLSIDLTKMPLKSPHGTARVLNSGTADYPNLNAAVTETGQLVINYDGNYVGQNVPASNWLTSNDEIELTFYDLPILGWSSNTTMSSDAGSRQVYLYSSRNTVLAIGSSSETYVPFDYATNFKDTTNSYNTTTGVFTFPESGLYNIQASVYWAGNSAGIRTVQIAGTRNNVLARLDTVPSTDLKQTGSITLYYNAGDTVGLTVYQTSGGNLNILANEPRNNFLSITKIQSPQQIAASEKVWAEYTYSSSGNGNTAIADSSTSEFVDYNVRVQDSHGAVTGTGTTDWRFTAPKAGEYTVCAMIFLNSSNAWEVGESLSAIVNKNGSNYRRLQAFYMNAAGTYYTSASGCTNLYLLKGDYIRINAYQDSDVSQNILDDGSVNWISIKSVD